MKTTGGFPDFVTGFTEAAVPFDEARAWLVQGDRNQVAFVHFTEAAEVPEHSHQEQWELVVAGTVLLRMDGEEQRFEAGDNFFVPAGTPHSARVSAGYRAVIIFNEPGRYGAQ